MTDTRNTDYPPHADWDRCIHEWKEAVDSMAENAVYCAKCGAPGDRDGDGDVYWPAT